MLKSGFLVNIIWNTFKDSWHRMPVVALVLDGCIILI